MGAFDAARSGLSVFSQQIGLVARNVANASDPDASRKVARVVTAATGDIFLAGVDRVDDRALREAALSATSQAEMAKAKVDGLNSLAAGVDGDTADRSPASLISKLAASLQAFASQPSSAASAGAAITSARSLADGLNEAARTVQSVREEADQKIAESVDRLNTSLARLETLNNRIVTGLSAGRDVSDDLDQRDALLGKISEDIGIRVVPRDSGAIALYTDSGITLFDGTARHVDFVRTPLVPGSPGGVVQIDGVPAAGPGAHPTMALGSGAIVGQLAARDDYALGYEAQLDEIARSLVEAFSEKDQTSSGNPDRPGLFTYPGATTTPTSGTLVSGLASIIQVNSTVDPSQGGDWRRLRDGGAAAPGNPAYVYNASGDVGYTDRLRALIAGLDSSRSFSAAAGLDTTSSISGYADRSVGWLSEQRSRASDVLDYRTAVRDHATSAVSNVVGVNLDQEMAHMLELERSYQASSRLITAADGLLQTLLQAMS
jgi:flagellar hook-associated protein 1 FlgK